MVNGELIMKKGYKRTEIGVIPVDWEVKKLGNCLSKNPDYGINAAAVDYTDTLPTYLRITDISDDGNYINKNRVSVNHQLSDFYFLEEGDIVFARTGASVGKTYLYNIKDGKLVFAGFLIRIKPNVKILNPTFLKFHTQTKYYWNWVLSNSMRSGQPGLNSNEYKSFKIPLPQLSEQKAIAKVLSDTDNLIQALEKRIAKKRLIKQGAMQKLLSPKEDWEVKKLGDEIEFQGGSQPPLTTFSSFKKEGYIRLLQIRDYKTDKYKTYIPQKLAKRFCKKSDIMIGRYGPPIFQILKGLEGAYNVALMKAIPSNSVSKQYVYYFLKQESLFLFIEKLSQRTSGQTGIDLKELRTYPFSLPPLPEQKAIATILSDMDSEIEALEKKLAKYKQLKQGLMQNLLTGKIRLI
jgi:type I restriction enzyme S subunit